MELSRQRRMRQWGEFQKVRLKGQSAAGRFLVVGILRDENLTDRKFGFITSKKTGNAVTRNLLRRRLREIVRHSGDHLPNHLMIVSIARWQASRASYQELEQDWIKILQRLKIWDGQTS